LPVEYCQDNGEPLFSYSDSSSCSAAGYSWKVITDISSTFTPGSTPSGKESAAKKAAAEKAAWEQKLAAEEAELRKEAEEQGQKSFAAARFKQSQENQAQAKVNEMRQSVKNIGHLAHNRIMQVFSWYRRNSRPGTKSVQAPKLNQAAPQTGMASGDEKQNYGVWFTPSSSWMKNTGDTSAYDGRLLSAMAGGDFTIMSNMLLGVSVGYEALDLDTDYNNGTLKDNGFTIAPYFGYTFTDNLVFDLLLGYTYLENDMDRIQGGEQIEGTFNHRGIEKTYSTQLSKERIKGSFDSNRFLVSANVNYSKLIENWNLSAVLGYMYANEEEDAYQEKGGYNFNVDSQTIYLSEWRLGGRAGYLINLFEPYISMAYLYDNAWSDGGTDRDELEGVLGCNYYPADNWIISFDASNSFFRDDIENIRLMYNLHYNF